MMIGIVVIGVFVLGCLIVYLRGNEKETEANARLLRDLSRKTDFIESVWKAAEKDCDKSKARIDALVSEVSNLNSNFQNLNSDLRGRLSTTVSALERVSKDAEFMKAHQHGMDKRIAGLKREVIVTINDAAKAPEPKKEKQTVTKNLLKRAGVTQ